MRSRLAKAVIVLLFFNLCFLVLLYGQSNWITKINDDKISLKEFNEAFRAVIVFGAMNSLVPVSDKKINEIFKDKAKKELYLHTYEDEYLILKKAEERGSYSKSEVDKQVKALSKLIKRQMIIKKFIQKEIWPKVKIKSSQVNKVYKEQTKKGGFKGVPKKQAIKYIKQQLKIQKTQIKYKDYTEKLRLEGIIIRNNSVLNR